MRNFTKWIYWHLGRSASNSNWFLMVENNIVPGTVTHLLVLVLAEMKARLLALASLLLILWVIKNFLHIRSIFNTRNSSPATVDLRPENTGPDL